MRTRWGVPGLIVLGLLLPARPAHLSAGFSAAAIPARRLDTALDQKVAAAYRAAYSLDQTAAQQDAREAVALAPNDPRAHRTLAAVLWVEILFRRGAVTIDAFMGGLTKSLLNLPKPPPDLDAEFKQEVARAIDLAKARLDQNSSDVNARYELGAAYGLQASYAASVEGSLTSAFSAGRHAYDAEETVLDRDPSRVGAGVIVGTYRYVVATMSLPSRLFAYMAGFGGGKQRGIQLVEAATKDPEAHVEARTALALIYTREGRHADAERELQALATEFPRNRLFGLEQAGAALRAKRPAEADALLSRGLAAFDRDSRPKVPGERALWLYKRGEARDVLKRYADANADLTNALSADPMPWVRGRIELELGKVADASGHHDAAVARYRQARDLSNAANDPAARADAERRLKRE